ncbi:histidinol-phosphate phosphatase [Pirellula staleyi DSM 6068]|uniref:Histidinol-phosphatase n=1 Tax=Pirellula staleyi (strain ATCC 27377 / DSM 6068 / ICPB 4128) TaxID=530564 RepID=D2R247_PIRSD|nr:histidinol-phosphatase [Pirellula staleyi]ADB18658.1 histidinol-phosphate phosphatase [Pirellula staleyi DSM 6068]
MTTSEISATVLAEVSRRLPLVLSAGKEAGQLTLRYFQQDNFTVEKKGDASPVTIADRSAEQLIRQRVAEHFPTDGIIGEEFGRTEGTSGFNWILDPIDGTKSFISGVPMYGTMVGVEFEGRSLAGLVYIPGLDEGVYASSGQGTFHFKGTSQPRRCFVSKKPQLSDGLFVTSQVDTFAKRGGQGAFEAVQKLAYITRTWGDCYGYMLVATGRAEVMIDPILNVWDAAAVQPIIEEAGGTFTDWNGVPTIHTGDAVATNGLVADEVLSITKRFPRTL